MIHLKFCKCCGEQFPARYATIKFCSTKCRQEYHSTHRPERLNKKTKKKCEACGREFDGTREQRYCSDFCRATKYNRNTQLCWTCQRATGYCSWSASLTPVKNWDAKMIKMQDGMISYRIKGCPLYLPETQKRL